MSDSNHVKALRTLGNLGRLRSLAPLEVARFEERICFSLGRLQDVQRPDNEPIRPDRLLISRRILDEHLRRAEAFIDAVVSQAEVLRVA